MCLQWKRVLYSVVITRQSNPPVHNSIVRVMNSRVSRQCSYTIPPKKLTLVKAKQKQ